MLKKSFLEAFDLIKAKISSVLQSSGVSLQNESNVICGSITAYSPSAVISQRARNVWGVVVSQLNRLACNDVSDAVKVFISFNSCF